jgi:hypothetical protein
MEKLIDIFCHAIRITDPLSIKIAVGIVGGGLPLIFLAAVSLPSRSSGSICALGHEQTFRVALCMSTLPPKADMWSASTNVAKGQ